MNKFNNKSMTDFRKSEFRILAWLTNLMVLRHNRRYHPYRQPETPTYFSRGARLPIEFGQDSLSIREICQQIEDSLNILAKTLIKQDMMLSTHGQASLFLQEILTKIEVRYEERYHKWKTIPFGDNIKVSLFLQDVLAQVEARYEERSQDWKTIPFGDNIKVSLFIQDVLAQVEARYEERSLNWKTIPFGDNIKVSLFLQDVLAQVEARYEERSLNYKTIPFGDNIKVSLFLQDVLAQVEAKYEERPHKWKTIPFGDNIKVSLFLQDVLAQVEARFEERPQNYQTIPFGDVSPNKDYRKPISTDYDQKCVPQQSNTSSTDLCSTNQSKDENETSVENVPLSDKLGQESDNIHVDNGAERDQSVTKLKITEKPETTNGSLHLTECDDKQISERERETQPVKIIEKTTENDSPKNSAGKVHPVVGVESDIKDTKTVDGVPESPTRNKGFSLSECAPENRDTAKINPAAIIAPDTSREAIDNLCAEIDEQVAINTEFLNALRRRRLNEMLQKVSMNAKYLNAPQRRRLNEILQKAAISAFIDEELHKVKMSCKTAKVQIKATGKNYEKEKVCTTRSENTKHEVDLNNNVANKVMVHTVEVASLHPGPTAVNTVFQKPSQKTTSDGPKGSELKDVNKIKQNKPSCVKRNKNARKEEAKIPKQDKKVAKQVSNTKQTPEQIKPTTKETTKKEPLVKAVKRKATNTSVSDTKPKHQRLSLEDSGKAVRPPVNKSKAEVPSVVKTEDKKATVTSDKVSIPKHQSVPLVHNRDDKQGVLNATEEVQKLKLKHVPIRAEEDGKSSFGEPPTKKQKSMPSPVKVVENNKSKICKPTVPNTKSPTPRQIPAGEDTKATDDRDTEMEQKPKFKPVPIKFDVDRQSSVEKSPTQQAKLMFTPTTAGHDTKADVGKQTPQEPKPKFKPVPIKFDMDSPSSIGKSPTQQTKQKFTPTTAGQDTKADVGKHTPQEPKLKFTPVPIKFKDDKTSKMCKVTPEASKQKLKFRPVPITFGGDTTSKMCKPKLEVPRPKFKPVPITFGNKDKSEICNTMVEPNKTKPKYKPALKMLEDDNKSKMCTHTTELAKPKPKYKPALKMLVEDNRSKMCTPKTEPAKPKPKYKPALKMWVEDNRSKMCTPTTEPAKPKPKYKPALKMLAEDNRSKICTPKTEPAKTKPKFKVVPISFGEDNKPTNEKLSEADRVASRKRRFGSCSDHDDVKPRKIKLRY